MLSRRLGQNGEALLTPCGGCSDGLGGGGGGGGGGPRHTALPPFPVSVVLPLWLSPLPSLRQAVNSVVPATLGGGDPWMGHVMPQLDSDEGFGNQAASPSGLVSLSERCRQTPTNTPLPLAPRSVYPFGSVTESCSLVG